MKQLTLIAILLAAPCAYSEEKTENKTSSSVTVTSDSKDGKGKAVIEIDVNGKKEKREIELPGGGSISVTTKATGDSGPVTFLGLLPVALTEAVAAQLPIDKGTGLLVAHVTPGSPAADAGLQKNDVLARFDDQILANAEQLQTLVRSKKPGAEVKLTYFRKGQQSTTTARLGSKEWKTEDVEALADAGNTLGSAISELEKTLKNKVGPELIESIRRALEDAGKAIEDGAAKK